VIAGMLRAGTAYHCYCTKQELDALREQQIARKEKPRYTGICRDRSAPRRASIRWCAFATARRRGRGAGPWCTGR